MNSTACIIVLFLLPATITPLTDEQGVAIETAYDGRDHNEAAFDAMVENVRAWTSDGISAAPAPDYDTLLAEPEQHRGELYLVTGVLRQQQHLSSPHEAIQEWFVGDIDRAVLIHVIQADGWNNAFRDGESVMINARFYKRATFTARDGKKRDYPAFVGAFPEEAPGLGQGGAVPWFLIPLVAVMLVAFAYLMVRVRRPREQRIRAHALRDESSSMEHDEVDLPDDPAGALAELKRRAEAMKR